MRSRINLARKIFYYTVLTVIAIFGVLLILPITKIGGVQDFSVQSGSMEPAIPVGSVVITLPQQEYQADNIITFKQDGTNETLTHRIYKVLPANLEDSKGIKSSEITYITKGDANNAPDSKPVAKNDILGKVFFTIPLVGYLVGFAKTLPGLILLIIIPAAIIAYKELVKIKNELVKGNLFRSRRNEIT